MLEFYVGYCTLPEICRRYTEILKQLQIFSDNLWAKNLRLKVYALLYVYAKKITQCTSFFVVLYRKLRRSQREAAIAVRKVCTFNALYFMW